MALWGTLHGYGLLARTVPENALLAYQAFLVFNSVMSLTVAAVAEQSRRAQAALQMAQSELETRVLQRTQVLEAEIAGRKRAEAALRESETRFRNLFERSPDAVFVETAEGKVVDVNPAACQLHGMTREELIGQHVLDLVPEGVRDEVAEQFPGWFSGETSFYEGLTRLRDGRTIPVEIRGAAIVHQGRPAIQLHVRDVSERKRTAAALQRAKDFAENLVKTANVMIVGLDANGRVRVFNEAAERVTGYTRAEITGRSWFELLVPNANLPAVWGEFTRLLLGETPLPHSFDSFILTKSGHRRLISWRNNEILEGDKPAGTLSFGIDLTEQRAVEKALTASETRYRRLFETAKDGIMILQAGTGEIADINPFLTEMLGYAREEMLGRRLWEVVPVHHQEACQSAFTELQRQKYIRHEHLPLQSKDGRHLEVEFVSNAYLVDDQEVIQCNIRDITQRRQAEAALRRAHEELERRVLERTAELRKTNRSLEAEIGQRRQAEEALSRVLSRLVDAQETERRRVARELHDVMGQQLAGLKLGLKLVKDEGPFAPPIARGLVELEATADQLMQDMHRLAWELRPPALDDFGLVPAIQRYTEEWSKHSGVAVHFHGDSLDTQRLPPQIETTLYRVTQEALTNVLKHAQARHVSVLLERRLDGISLIVEDDGEGFDAPTKLNLLTTSGKLGLLGMQERAMLVGGTVDIESTPGAGTAVYVRIHWESPPAKG